MMMPAVAYSVDGGLTWACAGCLRPLLDVGPHECPVLHEEALNTVALILDGEIPPAVTGGA